MAPNVVIDGDKFISKTGKMVKSLPLPESTSQINWHFLLMTSSDTRLCPDFKVIDVNNCNLFLRKLLDLQQKLVEKVELYLLIYQLKKLMQSTLLMGGRMV